MTQARGTAALGVEDRLAIADLVHRYAASVDRRDIGAAAALFAEDAVLATPHPPRTLTPVREFRGRPEIRAALERVLALDATVHEIVGHIIDPGGEPGQATGRTACVAHHLAGALDEEWHLHYDDRYVREGAAWRFAHRSLTVDAMRTSALRAGPGLGGGAP